MYWISWGSIWNKWHQRSIWLNISKTQLNKTNICEFFHQLHAISLETNKTFYFRCLTPQSVKLVFYNLLLQKNSRNVSRFFLTKLSRWQNKQRIWDTKIMTCFYNSSFLIWRWSDQIFSFPTSQTFRVNRNTTWPVYCK